MHGLIEIGFKRVGEYGLNLNYRESKKWTKY